MNTDPRSYLLPEAEADAIFEQQIVPAELPRPAAGPTRPGHRPVAVIVAGQTGAGKTRTAPGLLAALRARARGRPGGPEPAHLIADTFKTYHPAHARLLRLGAGSRPGLAGAACGADARRWLAMACARVARGGHGHGHGGGGDVLLETACREAGELARLVGIFASGGQGYSVRVVFLGVPAGLSRLGVLVRFHHGLAEAGSRGLPARLTPGRVHDESFGGVGAAAAWVDGDAGEGPARAVDRVVVVRRGGRVAYRAARGEDGRWGVGKGIATAAAAVERERGLLEGWEAETARRELEGLRARGLGEELAVPLAEIEGLLGALRRVEDGEGEGGGEVEVLDCAEFVLQGLGGPS